MGPRMVWLGLLAVLGGLVGFGMSLRPWQLVREQRQELARVKTEMREAESERATLVRRQRKQQTGDEREVLARERGYVRPDEVPLDIK